MITSKYSVIVSAGSQWFRIQSKQIYYQVKWTYAMELHWGIILSENCQLPFPFGFIILPNTRPHTHTYAHTRIHRAESDKW